MRSKELFPAVFSRHARSYQQRQDCLRRQGGLRARLLLIDAVEAAPGDCILDLACGPGTITLELAQRVAPDGQAVGIDLAPGMLEAAQARASAGLAVRFELMDMEELRFPDASFDAVTCGHGLQFVPDLDRALAEARRVLRAGGRFATTVPHESSGLAESIVNNVAGDRLPPLPEAPDRAVTRAIVADQDDFRAHVQRAGFGDVRVRVIEEVQRWASAAEMIGFASAWWVLAARLDQVSARDRAEILAEAQRALEAERGTGPIESTVSSLLVLADA